MTIEEAMERVRTIAIPGLLAAPEPMGLSRGTITNPGALAADLRLILDEVERLRAWESDFARALRSACFQRDAAEARAKRLEDALRWVLPMAKGYAHEHPVGDNQGKVDAAAAALEPTP